MNGFANLNIVLLFQDAPNAIKVLGSLVFDLLTSAGIGHSDYDFFYQILMMGIISWSRSWGC